MAKFLIPVFTLVALLALCIGLGMGHPVASAVVQLMNSLNGTNMQFQLLLKQAYEYVEHYKAFQKNYVAAAYIGNSLDFCCHHDCTFGPAYFDTDHDKCVCPWGPAKLIRKPEVEDRLHPTAKCTMRIECVFPLLPVFNPVMNDCVCSLYPFPRLGELSLDLREANKTNLNKERKMVQEYQLREVTNSVTTVITGLDKLASRVFAQQFHHHLHRRESPTITDAVPLAPLPTFVPPPKTDITPSLIEQSLAIKPQKNAIVHSIIPHFDVGVITFHVQLDGPFPQSLQLNATDSMPCDTIESGVESNMILVPRNVNNGTKEVVIPDCLIVAVNKVNASWINYWVQKNDGTGTIHSVLGDAQVHDIDQLDTSKPAALAIRVSTSVSHQKRAVTNGETAVAHLKRQEVVMVNCADPCTVNGTSSDRLTGGVCICLVEEFKPLDLVTRALDEPNAYNAIMTADTCASMTCVNNGDKKALFNPFSKTCWCATPTLVEVNDSAPSA